MREALWEAADKRACDAVRSEFFRRWRLGLPLTYDYRNLYAYTRRNEFGKLWESYTGK